MGPVEVVICSGHLYHHFGVGDNPGRKFYLFYVPLSTSVPKFLTTKQVHRSAKKIQKCRKFIYVRLKRVILKVILSQFRGHVFIFWPNGNFRDNLPVIIFRAKILLMFESEFYPQEKLCDVHKSREVQIDITEYKCGISAVLQK